jgi:hypothetical protein
VRVPEGEDARVGDDDVDVTEAIEPGFKGQLDRVEVAHIGVREDDLAACFFDETDCFLDVVLRGQGVRHGVVVFDGVESDDVRALLGQPQRVIASLPASSTRDECDLAFESSGHEDPPVAEIVV